MRDLPDLFAALSRSRFRSRFHLCDAELKYLQSKGMEQVLAHGRQFIAQRLAPAEPPNDGQQTPMRGHPIFVAQHATATCCRSCLQKWHGIPAGRELTQSEQEYIHRVIAAWIGRNVPEMPPPEPTLFP